MSDTPRGIKELYLSAIKLSPRIYFKLKYFFLGAILLALTLYTFVNHIPLDFADKYPGTILALSSLFSCVVYGFLGSITYNIFSQHKTNLRTTFFQFFKLQGKWWGGMLLLVLPALTAVGLNQSVKTFSLASNSPYITIAIYFIAVVLACWSFLYLPMFIIYLFSLFSEPNLPFITSLKYVFRLCCYNWLRIVFSTVLYYGMFLLVFDFISTYYLRHLSKGPYFLTNLICVNLIFYCLFPLLTAFNMLLVSDLRVRNLPCTTTCN